MTTSSDSKIAVTIDIDWACEYAIEETFNFFEKKKIPITLFTTHNSSVVRERLDDLEVGLHPFFHIDSSHGDTLEKTIETVLKLPHNLKAFRCHRFINSNEIQDGMKNAGMLCSSNVCTNLEILNPFYTRNRLLEIPIYLEDGGYLYNNHDIKFNTFFKNGIASKGLKTIIIHPMHFVLNTPKWDYMRDIKRRLTRLEWNGMLKEDVYRLRNNEYGIRSFFEDFFEEVSISNTEYTTIGQILKKHQ